MKNQIIGIILLIGLFVIIVKLNTYGIRNKKTGNKVSPQDTVDGKKKYLDKNHYPELRMKAFSVTPDFLLLNLPIDKTVVFGVIMDWEIGKGVSTVVAFQTGDASFYISTGQIFIGGYAHETIIKASKDFVASAQTYLDKAEKTDDYSKPAKDCIKFFLLTNNGIFAHPETVNDIKDNKNEWSSLFYKGNQIITEYLIMTENK